MTSLLERMKAGPNPLDMHLLRAVHGIRDRFPESADIQALCRFVEMTKAQDMSEEERDDVEAELSDYCSYLSDQDDKGTRFEAREIAKTLKMFRDFRS